jgi:hypothetical protein
MFVETFGSRTAHALSGREWDQLIHRGRKENDKS